MAVQAAFKERRHQEQTGAKLQQVRARYGLGSHDAGSEEEEEGSLPPGGHSPAVSDHESDLSISDLTDSGEWGTGFSLCLKLLLSLSLSGMRLFRQLAEVRLF